MSKPNFLNVQKEIEKYDAGTTAQDTTPIDVNVTSVPQAPMPVYEEVSPGDDGKYGFVDANVLDKPELKAPDQPILGFNPTIDYTTNALGFSEYSGEGVRTALRDSDLSGFQDFSMVGKLWRSVAAGVGSQIFTAAGNAIDWIDGVGHLVTGTEEQGRSIYDAKNPEGTPSQRGEEVQNPLVNWNPLNPLAVFNVFEYFTGIDPVSSLTDTLRKAGSALETIDDKIEEQYKDEYGEQFIKRDAEGNIKVDYSQLFVMDFWLTKVAKQLPNMVMFAGTGLAGKALSAKAYHAANATKLVSSMKKSNLGKKFIEVGTKRFGDSFSGLGTAEVFGGALGANLSEGTILAGEAYKEALSEGLTKDQAAVVGLQVMGDNAKYMAVDALKWSIFDKGIRTIPAGLRRAAKLEVGTGTTFKTFMASLTVGSGLTYVSGKAEEFQEVYQDWRIKTRLAHMKGEEFMSYSDYYNSPEIAETRLVSFGMGVLTGGFGVTLKSAVNDAAIASNIIDEKIETSGFMKGGSGLVFQQSAENIKNRGTAGGKFTADEIIVNEKHKVVEDIIASSVASGEASFNKKQIVDKLEKSKFSKQEVEASLQLLEDMDVAFQPFRSAKLDRQYRMNAAKIAYSISMEEKILAENNENYQTQIEAIQNSSRSEARKKQEIKLVEEEMQTAQEMSMQTIENYHNSIDQLKAENLQEAMDDAAAVDAKNENKRNAAQRAKTDEVITRERASQAKQEKTKTKKQTPAQRKNRIKEINNQIKNLQQEREQIDTEVDGTREAFEAVEKQISDLNAEKLSLESLDKKDAGRKTNLENIKKRKAAKKKTDPRQQKLFQKKDPEKKPTDNLFDKKDTKPKFKTESNGVVIPNRQFGVEAVYRERLRKKGISLVVYDHFSKTQDGKTYWGLAQGLSVFLDANKATQETFFHELSHVYLLEYWDSAPVKKLREIIIDQPVFQEAKRMYMNELVLSNGRKFGEMVSSLDGIITKNQWKRENPDKAEVEYVDYVASKLKKRKIKILPDAKQRVVVEEAVADLISKSKDNQDLNGLIALPKKKTVLGRMKAFFSKAKNRKLSKEDRDAILKESGNESLIDNENALNDVIKDYEAQTMGKEGRFNFRRTRNGFKGKVAMPSTDQQLYNNIELGGIVQDLFGAYESLEEVGMRLEKDSKGEYTPAAKKRYQAWVLDTWPKVKEDIQELYEGDGKGNNKQISETLWENWSYEEGISRPDFVNQRRYLNQVIRRRVGGAAKTEWADIVDEESWLESYLDTRNGENETVSKWVEDFSNMTPNIQGERDVKRLVRKYIWRAIHGKQEMSTKEEFADNMNALIKKWNSKVLIDGKLRQNKDTGFNLMQETLVKYGMFLKQLYKNNGWDSENVFNELYHDVSSYKKISWFTYFNDLDGKTTLKPYKGTQLIHGKTFDKAQSFNGEEIQSIFENNFANIQPNSKANPFLKYLTRIVKLQETLESTTNVRQKRKLAADFIYDQFVLNMSQASQDIESSIDLIDTQAVDEIIADNAESLIKNTARMKMSDKQPPAEIKKRLGNFLGKPEFLTEKQKKFRGEQMRYRFSQGYFMHPNNKKQLEKLFNKSLQYYKEDGTSNGRVNVFQGIRVGDKIGNAFGVPVLGTIAKSITEAQAEAKFDSMIKMPGGEMTANISKSHQIDIAIRQIADMNNTEEGKAKLKDLFGDNPIIERMIKTGEAPVIKQIIGGNIKERVPKIGERIRGFDSGRQTANEMTDMHISLIQEAINNNSKTYSQSISIFGDKRLELHLNNANLYSLTEARDIANKLSSKKAQEYVNDLNTYLKTSRAQSIQFVSKEQIEQIALNYFINKYYAKDLLIGPAQYFKNTKDYVKRAVGSVAMHVALGSDFRIEPIMLKDVMTDIVVNGKTVQVNAVDACTFCLESDGQVINERYGKARPVGSHFKFVYNGQNYDNKTFENKVGKRHPFYGKTNTFVLTDQFVADNPKFAPLKRALEARKEATRGTNKEVIPMIMFESSIKVLGENANGIFDTLIEGKEGQSSVDALEQMLNNNTFNKHQDDLFTDNTGESTVHGLDGSYIGVQTELDKVSKDNKGTLSKQLTHMLYSNPEIVKQADDVMQSLIDSFKGEADNVFSNFGTTEKQISKEKLNSILYRVFDKADKSVFGPSVVNLLRQGSLDSGTLSVIKNIIAKNIVKSATKFRGPGGLGIQSTDFGIRVDRAGIVGDGLNHYIIEDGVITSPAEIVLDSSVAASLNLEIGSEVIVQRIPTSKLGDGVVCKVVQITENMGTMAAISAETSSILGSDLDGDSLHIIGKHPKTKLTKSQQLYNEAFDKLKDFLMLPENMLYTQKGINELDGYMQDRLSEIKNLSKEVPAETIDDLSILGNRNMYISNRGSQDMIGVAAVFNNGHKILSSGEAIGIDLNTIIDGKYVDNMYKDKGNSWIDLAYMLNMFLDDANKGFATSVNLNEHTYNTASELVSRGVGLDTAIKIINHPFIKKLVSDARLYNDSITNQALRYLGPKKEFSKNRANALKETVDLNINNNFYSNNDKVNNQLALLLIKTNDLPSMNQLDALRQLASLDSRMPSTTAEGVEMIDSILNVSMGSKKTKEGVDESFVDVSNMVSVAPGVTLNDLKESIFDNDLSKLRESITFSNPILQNNFNTLTKAIENQRKIDPAYTGGFYNVINRVFPLQKLFTSAFEMGLTKRQKIQTIENIENRLRSVRLMQSDVYKNINATEILTGLESEIQINDEVMSKEELDRAMDSVVSDDMPLDKTFDKTIAHLKDIKGAENFEYLSEFIEFETVSKENRGGYVVGEPKGFQQLSFKQDGVASELYLPNLEHKSREEFIMKPRIDKLKSTPISVVKEMFESMPAEYQEFMYLYDLVNNNHGGPNTLFPYLHGEMKESVVKETQRQVLDSQKDIKEGALSNASIEMMHDDLIVNNKGSIIDVTNRIKKWKKETQVAPGYWNGLQQGVTLDNNNIKIEAEQTKGIPYGSIVKLTLDTSNEVRTAVLYRTSQEPVLDGDKSFMVLTPVLNSFKRNKTIPSKQPASRDSRTKGKMYMLVDEKVSSTSRHNSLGKTQDGKNIVDNDGRFGSTKMYMLVEEEEMFNESTSLSFDDYLKLRGEFDENLSRSKRKKYIKEYNKYLNDLNEVEILQEKYLKKDENGVTHLEDQYSSENISKIIETEIYPLDEVARRNLYNTMVKVLAAKAAIKGLDNIIKLNKLSKEKIKEYESIKKKISSGSKNLKDVNWGRLYMDPDITTVEMTEVGEMIKQIEESEMRYQRDLNKIQNETNKAHDELMKDRFKNGLIPWWLKSWAYKVLPGVRHLKIMNRHIYKNIVYEAEKVDENGHYYRVLELKDYLDVHGKPSTFRMKKAGLSQAEQNYYKMFIEKTSMFQNHMSQKNGMDGMPILQHSRTKLYIPNRSGGFLETMAARNMTATFIAFNYDSTLKDVVVTGKHPLLRNEEVTKPLAWFINKYKISQMDEGISLSDYRRKQELKSLQNQAERKVRNGKAVRAEKVEDFSQGKSFNRYLSGRSSRSEFSASFDIHQNLNDYVEKNLFSHGLETQKGYSYTGAMSLAPIIDGVISYNSFKGNPQAQKWVQELWKDRYLMGKSKKSIINQYGKKHWADKIATGLIKWTMFIGLALAPAVGVSNIAVGKINEYRRSGSLSMRRGEKRWWGEMYRSKAGKNNKVFGISDYFGLLTNPTAMTTDGFFDGPIGSVMFWFMTASESYIQRTAFASQLTDAEFDSFEMENGVLKIKKGQNSIQKDKTNEEVFEGIKQRASEMKYNVYKVQGRGYTNTDQRLIQNYYILEGALQFKRWFPTFVMDRLGNERINRFGGSEIGSLTASWQFLKDIWQEDGVAGVVDIRKWGKNSPEYQDLPKHRQEAIQRMIRGGKASLVVLALLALGGWGEEDEDDSFVKSKLEQLLSDIFLISNVKRLHYMAAPPMFQTGKNITEGFANFFSNAKYQRKTKYFEKGDPKAKGSFIKLLPRFLREVAFENKDK